MLEAPSSQVRPLGWTPRWTEASPHPGPLTALLLRVGMSGAKRAGVEPECPGPSFVTTAPCVGGRKEVFWSRTCSNLASVSCISSMISGRLLHIPEPPLQGENKTHLQRYLWQAQCLAPRRCSITRRLLSLLRLALGMQLSCSRRLQSADLHLGSCPCLSHVAHSLAGNTWHFCPDCPPPSGSPAGRGRDVPPGRGA